MQGATITYLAYVYTWRSGSNTASLTVEGIKGRIQKTAATKLARKQQARIVGAYAAG